MQKPDTRVTGFEYERRALQHVSRSFALTIPQLPPALQDPVTNAYLICRIIDTIEDEESLTPPEKSFFFREFLDVLNGRTSGVEFADALCPKLNGRTLPQERELIGNTPLIISDHLTFSPRQQTAIRRCAGIMADGMSRFQAVQDLGGLRDLGDLEEYCYYVAGVVGEMLTELFCDYSDRIAENRKKLLELAVSFGKGLQLTNIVKDLWDDNKQGVCWLPRALFGASAASRDPLMTSPSESLTKALAVVTDLARSHLERALAYTLLIPRSETGIRRFCLWAIGMAVFTLNNADKRMHRENGSAKISRRALKAIILVTNAAARSNFCLETLFRVSNKMPAKENSHQPSGGLQ